MCQLSRTLFMEINSCRWFVSLFPSSLYHLFTMDIIGGFLFYIHSWRHFFLNIFSSPLKRICILLRIGVVDRWGCPQTIPAPLTSHSLTTLRSPRDQNSLSPIQTEFARAISNVNSQTLQCWLEIRESGLMIARFDVCEKHTWRTMNLIAVLLK